MSATASSGLAVIFAASGNCTISGSIVHITGVGSCTITASQNGDSNWKAAPDVSRIFSIAKANQAALVLTVPTSITYGTTDTAATTGGSGAGAVTFSAGGSTGCSVNATAGVISVTNASSTCSIGASKDGDNNYNGPVTDGPESVTLVKADQAIIFTSTAPSDATYGDTYSVSAKGGASGNPVAFSSSTSSVCTVSGTTVSFVGVGTCTVKANQAGNDNYKAAPEVSQTFKVYYRWDGLLQPIDDTAHQTGTITSVFKAGSTVPVKFQIKKASGTIVQANTLPQWVTPSQGSGMTASVDESVYTDSATTGGTYRWDSTAQQYIYNWNTKGVTPGYYYRVSVTLDDGQTYYVNIGPK